MKLKFLATFVALSFLTTSLALASGIPVGVGGNPPDTFPGDLVDGIEVGSDTNPIQIWLDPDEGFWPKTFVIDASGVGLNPGDKIPVWEHIQLIPPPPQQPPIPVLPLTDWHEEIHTPDWRWTGGDFTIHNLPHIEPGVVGGVGGDTIWFDWGFPVFPPPGGLDIWIHKELEYIGVPITPNPEGATLIPVDIWEHPTVPEPASVVLATIGLVGLAAFGWRRRKR